MRRTGMIVLVLLGLLSPIRAATDDAARVAYVPNASPDHARFQQRARSDRGRQLRQEALAKRDAYEAALARLPAIAALDQEIAAAQAEQQGLEAARKATAEQFGRQYALERDAWLEARDALTDLQARPQADPGSVAEAQRRADVAQQAFREAVESIPAIQDVDAKINTSKARLSQAYIQRRTTETAHAADLAAEHQAMTEAENAYLQYVYGQ